MTGYSFYIGKLATVAGVDIGEFLVREGYAEFVETEKDAIKLW